MKDIITQYDFTGPCPQDSDSTSLPNQTKTEYTFILVILIYYGAEGGVLELLETGAPYAPHVKAKIT